MQVTLNFLSPEKKSDLRTGFILAYAQTALLFLFIFVTFASGVLLALRLFIAGTFSDIDSRVQKMSDDSKTLSGSVDKVNAYLGRIDRYERRFVAWSPVIAEISKAVPPGAQITSLLIAPDGTVTLSGSAAQRDDVLTMQDNLKKSPMFKNVTAPLSNILQEQDVKFNFSMNYANMPNVPPEGFSAPRGRKPAS